MQTFKYIQYFLYLAYNWNLRVARHILLNEIRGEKKYGINTTGADELKSLEKKGIDIQHSTIYMPASYDVLEQVFQKANLGSFNHLVDIGCGKGRALCVAAFYGVKQVTGIELSKEFCEATKQNLELIKDKFPQLRYRVYNNNAFYFEIPDDADCIFMFNPFDEVIMSAVVKNIETSLQNNPREISIIYLNPLEKHLFRENDYKEVHHQKMITYLEAVILTKSPPQNAKG